MIQAIVCPAFRTYKKITSARNIKRNQTIQQNLNNLFILNILNLN